MQVPGSMYFGEMCECTNFQCGVDTRQRLCSGKEEMLASHALYIFIWPVIYLVQMYNLGIICSLRHD